jgi:hypothetical protein
MEDGMMSIYGRNESKFVNKGIAYTDFVCKEVPFFEFKENLSSFINKVQKSFDSMQDQISSFYLDTIELHIDVSASGKISLIGALEIGSTGGIKLTFKQSKI